MSKNEHWNEGCLPKRLKKVLCACGAAPNITFFTHVLLGEGVFILECFATAGLPLYKALGWGFPLTIMSLTLSQCYRNKQENRAKRIS